MTTPAGQQPEAVKAGLRAYRHALYDRPAPAVLSDEALIAQVIEAAEPHLEAAAREWIAQLADQVDATYPVTCCEQRCRHHWTDHQHSFAGLLRREGGGG